MNIAAGAVTAAPRDEPNAAADREALTLVKPYQGMVAWNTVFVAIAIVGGVRHRHHAWRDAHHPALARADPE